MAEIESTREAGSGPGLVERNGHGGPGIGTYVGTVAVVGLGAALFEVELLAGMALGVAAMAIPSLMPKLGTAFRPVLKSAVRAGYGMASKTRETVAEMGEQFQDVVAEVRAEQAEQTEGEEAAAGAEPAGAGHEAHEAGAGHEHARGRKSGRTHSSSGEM